MSDSITDLTPGTDLVKKLEFKVSEEWAKFAKENSWAAFIPEYAIDSTGQNFMKARGRSAIYKLKTESEGKQTYECNECGTEIMVGSIPHPIWDGPFPCSGSGKCHYEDVPYCPKCEKEPNFHGTPIQVK